VPRRWRIGIIVMSASTATHLPARLYKVKTKAWCADSREPVRYQIDLLLLLEDGPGQRFYSTEHHADGHEDCRVCAIDVTARWDLQAIFMFTGCPIHHVGRGSPIQLTDQTDQTGLTAAIIAGPRNRTDRQRTALHPGKPVGSSAMTTPRPITGLGA
jgi:hypothetical protein